MKTRKCRKCGGVYTLDKFVKHKTSLFGRLHKCKECKNKACRNRKAYYKKYPYANHYHSGKQRCNYPKHNRYKYYGGKGIKWLLTMKDVGKMWFKDKAYLLKRPSLDRKDSNGNYDLYNTRFIELSENSGRNLKKPVINLSTGNIYVSQAEAAKKTEFRQNIISKHCLNQVSNPRWAFA